MAGKKATFQDTDLYIDAFKGSKEVLLLPWELLPLPIMRPEEMVSCFSKSLSKRFSPAADIAGETETDANSLVDQEIWSQKINFTNSLSYSLDRAFLSNS